MKPAHPTHSHFHYAPGDHICSFYHSDAEQYNLLTQYIAEGVDKNEKCVYVIDSHQTAELIAALKSRGIETDKLMKRAQLSFLRPEHSTLQGGSFDPGQTEALFKKHEQQALSEGFSGLRVAAEMTWSLHRAPGSQRLLEFESRLNNFYPKRKITALCQYDMRRFTPDVLVGALNTHPQVVIGKEPYTNQFYVPPEDYLGPGRSAAILRLWLDSLAVHKRLETGEDVLGIKSTGALSLLDSIAFGFAHQIKSPLQIILQGAAFIQAGNTPVSPEQKVAAEEVERAVMRINDTLDRLIVSAKRATCNPKSAQLSRVILATLKIARKRFEQPGTRVTTEFESYIPKVVIDNPLLTRAFMALFANAFQAMPKGGTLSVKIVRETISRSGLDIGRRTGDTFYPGETIVVCEIKDSGIGIPKELIDKVFDPLFSYPAARGLGLGLPSARAIIEQHRGLVRLKSKKGQGTTVTVMLPVAQT